METIAVIDNYDSFTYNLVQYLSELGAKPAVYRNDEVSVERLSSHQGLVISPGPGDPAEAGVSTQAVQALSGALPILGVCLGHQCVAEAFGAEVVRGQPVHGKTSLVHHDGSAPFTGLPDPFSATRYHSLVVDRATLSGDLVVSAWTDDGVVMGLRHREHPTYGVQFHPESILTPEGKRILASFLGQCRSS